VEKAGRILKQAGIYKRLVYILRTVLIVLSASFVCLLLNRFGIEKENGLMIFLVGVLLISAFTEGYKYGMIGAIVSVMMFNYFFTVPVHTFAIRNPNDVALLVFFLIAACISSSLTVRFQKQLLISQRNEQTALRLSEMSEKFINVTGKENIIRLGEKYVQEYTGYVCVVEEKGKADARGNYLLFPIGGILRQQGILKVFNNRQGLHPEQEMLIKAAANQMGIALDREMIYAQQEQTRLEVEREHMKGSMLRSISHDFRTPLTGIIGDCGLILNGYGQEERKQKKLVRDIMEQAIWLNKMMENILSMTKIESGAQFIETSREVVDDLVYEAEKHIIGLKEHRDFCNSLPKGVITVQADGKMIIQVLVNLLDNAMKHTEEGGKISLHVFFRKGRAYFIVEDDGKGIEEGMEEKIFEEFVSISEGNGQEKNSADRKRGIGLGLAICKEVVRAHGGKIWAENRTEGGARFTFWLNAEQVG
jgi:two-component system sensor histidine kinase KdpD